MGVLGGRDVCVLGGRGVWVCWEERCVWVCWEGGMWVGVLGGRGVGVLGGRDVGVLGGRGVGGCAEMEGCVCAGRVHHTAAVFTLCRDTHSCHALCM